MNSPSNGDIPNCDRFGCVRVPARASQSPAAESVPGRGATVGARDGAVAGYIPPETRGEIGGGAKIFEYSINALSHNIC